MVKKFDILNFLYAAEKEFFEDGEIIFVRESAGAETGTALRFNNKEYLVDIYTFDLR